MNAVNPTDVLNRLMVVHHRSLPMYLSYASPTWIRGDDRAREVLQVIATDQQQMVDELGEMIVDSDGSVQFGGFPMRFTAYHDLSFDYLLTKLIEHQQRDVATIDESVAQLASAPLAQSLAQEASEMAKRHLGLLEELKHTPRSAAV
jgi:hypothetical protein